MGQYYVPVIEAPDGRVMTLYSHEFDNGLKLTEHSWIGNDFVNAALSLIFKSPKRVAWIGDYSKGPYPKAEPYTRAMPLKQFKRYFDCAWNSENTRLSKALFSSHDLEILTHETERMYLVNHSRKIYIDMDCYMDKCTVRGGDWDGYCMNPFPLLTACGNGRGGGDYNSEHVGSVHIGTWAFDTIELTNVFPNGFDEVIYEFFD